MTGGAGRPVLDASVVVELPTGASGAPSIRPRLRGARLLAPDPLDPEVLSVLRRWSRSGAVGRRVIDGAREGPRRAPIVRMPSRHLAEAVWDLPEDMTVYDAAYVAPADRLACPLLTRDAAPARGAGPGSAVEVI